MKVAVLGSRGMAGHLVADYLDRFSDISVTRWARSGDRFIDITKQDSVEEVLDQLHDYDFIINCTGLLVADSISRPDLAALVNSWFPHHLEYRFSKTNTRVVHLSTDCVFDGSTGFYTEDHPSSEQNAYGKSKSLGEISNSKDITLRTSIIGPELNLNGTGLMNWFINKSENTVTGYTDAWWSGITTLELAKCIHKWISNPTTTGIYHLVNNNNNINKYDLLCLINEVYGLNKQVLSGSGNKKVNKILVDTRGQFDWGIPDYRTQLTELKSWYQS
jgi:dTDP-4-dehydrorhamnose reductase